CAPPVFLLTTSFARSRVNAPCRAWAFDPDLYLHSYVESVCGEPLLRTRFCRSERQLAMPTMTKTDVDIAIVGAGPVGSVLALALVRAGISVAVIEAKAPPVWDESKTDLRVFALSRASQNILARLDVWDRIASARASAYDAMEVWEAGGEGCVRFGAADVDEADLGHIVEGNLLAAVLAERVQN